MELGDLNGVGKDTIIYLCSYHLPLHSIFSLCQVNKYLYELIQNNEFIWQNLCIRLLQTDLQNLTHNKPQTMRFREYLKEEHEITYKWNPEHRDQKRTKLFLNGLGIQSDTRGIWFPFQIGKKVLPTKGKISFKFRCTDSNNSYIYPGVHEIDRVQWTDSTLPLVGEYGKFYKRKYITMHIDCNKRTLNFETYPPDYFETKSFSNLNPKKTIPICCILYCEPIYLCPRGEDPIENELIKDKKD